MGIETVINVSDLHMRYGIVEAVRGLDLQVRRGEVFAFDTRCGDYRRTSPDLGRRGRGQDGIRPDCDQPVTA
ncbi:hypothetical protein [Actinoplanes subtropicus]|uniref:hypothetical protein n=1 Tax=Actinoplanes subtropicus TaxID=543632 RepID=UPI0004C32A7A|nr:hypothetical protein [Actinoplanes subtropicus]